MKRGFYKNIILAVVLGIILLPATLAKAETIDGVSVGEKYEFKKMIYPKAFSSGTIYDEEEFALKADTLKEFEVLKTKTTSKYEIALAYNDGSFTFYDKANSLEEAKQKLANIATLQSEATVVPTVINNLGQVVYGTKTMGKFMKFINGKPDETFNNITHVYMDSALTKKYTYINHGYVDDTPIIEDIGNAAKVQVNGYTGWVNKNSALSEYDLIVVPINQVTNPSYYWVKDGVLYHYISSDLANEGQRGHSISIGPAPQYLKAENKYFSYDGKYFYDGSNIISGLEVLISDLQNNNNENAINKSTPYYNYYKYLPFRSVSALTAGNLDWFIANNTEEDSLLRGMGSTFLDCQVKYGVNALIALGIAINESAWGQSDIAKDTNNLFGMGAVDFMPEGADKFATPADSIIAFTKEYISRGYGDPIDYRYFGGFLGDKNLGANVFYAADPFWGEKAAQYMFMTDFYLANSNVNNLREYNAYSLIMHTGSNLVLDKNGNELYNIFDRISDNGSFKGAVSVLINNKVMINGKEMVEIYAERNTPIYVNGAITKFSGNYNWNNKGYINLTNFGLINDKNQINIKPIINEPILNVQNSTIKIGQAFDPLKGVTAIDSNDGYLTNKIVITSNNVNDNKEGVYSITYEVKNSNNLVAKKTAVVTVSGKLTLDEIYSNAYNATKKALQEKSQKSVNEGRAAVAKLPVSLKPFIGEFSKQLDTVQHPILVRIVKGINKAKAEVTQKNIDEARSYIDPDLTNKWKYAYSSAIDSIQQGLLVTVTNAVAKAEAERTTESINVARAYINDVLTAKSSSLVSWARLMDGKLDNIK